MIPASRVPEEKGPILVSAASGGASFPTLPPARVPSVGLTTTLQYWYSYLVRHYAHGPEKGLYGPPKHRQLLRKIEARIAARSESSQPAPTLEIPSVDGDMILIVGIARKTDST